MASKISVIKFNNTVINYLKYLSVISDYSFNIKNNIIYIKSIQKKTWNLATISQNDINLTSLTLSSEGSTNTKWKKILKDIKTLAPNLKVVSNQQLGLITAVGLPASILTIDEYLTTLKDSANQQIHLEVKVLDILVDKATGKGINWNIISSQSSKFQIGSTTKSNINEAGILSLGSIGGASISLGKKISLELLLNLLSRQGKVKIENQPNITITNGRKAYITTGDEFSYIKSINSIPGADGSSPVVTSEIDRMTVGVNM